ncbi:MAG: transglycosylase SLT domain-containing protein [Cyanobacteriota bacterium]
MFNSVSNFLNTISFGMISKPSNLIEQQSVSSLLNNSQELNQIYNNDSFSINNSFNNKNPKEQLNDLGRKYGVSNTTGNLNDYQSKVAKAIITQKAIEYGVPINIALAVSKHESGMKMWNFSSNDKVIQGKNKTSTDWGVMQINDHAHAKAFPKVKDDMEANIDYGIKLLSKLHTRVSGSLALGFGNWDRTIASYNLGHNPSSIRDYAIAQNYVLRTKYQSLRV